MKKFKKFFAVLLTLAMVLGMSMTTFAEEPAEKPTRKVEVTGLQEGVTVSYARILTQDANNNWIFEENVKGKLTWDDGSAVDETELTEENTSRLSGLNGLSNLSYEVGATVDEGKTSVSLSLPAGLYAIKAVDSNNLYMYSFMIAKVDYQNGVLVGMEGKDALTAKGQPNIPQKTALDTSVAQAGTVRFTVTVKYPEFATGSTEKNMEITDNVTNGTILEGTVSIDPPFADKFTAPEVTNTTDSVTKKQTATLSTSLIASKYDKNLAGQDVIIKYTVQAQDVEFDNITNTVTSTVPDQDGDNHLSQAVVIVPTVNATITKVDENDAPITDLSATFELWKEDPNGEDLKVYDVSNPEGKTIQAVKVTEGTTNEEGKVTFKGLQPDGTVKYYVKEKVAPSGYAIEPLAKELTGATVTKGSRSPEPVVINDVPTWTTTHTATDFTKFVGLENTHFQDSKLSSLPSTGGIGTTIFTIGGCLIMIIAAGLFFASRRKANK